MDLSAFDTSKATDADCVLKHPATSEDLIDEKSGEPVSIRLCGADSKEYQKIAHDQQNSRIRRVASRGRIEITSEEMESSTMKILVACTKGWKHIIVDGEEVSFSPEECFKLYNRFRWIREQVETFILNRSNFLGNS